MGDLFGITASVRSPGNLSQSSSDFDCEMSATSSECVCIPAMVDGHPFNPWIASTFHDCIYTYTDYVSYICGWINIALFMVALCPQIVVNYKSKKVDALSVGFVIQWLLGDIFNLIGCLLTNQLPTQTYLAIYFCFLDGVLLVQYYFYYKKPYLPMIVDVDDSQAPSVSQGPTPRRPSPLLMAIMIPFMFTQLSLYSKAILTSSPSSVSSTSRVLLADFSLSCSGNTSSESSSLFREVAGSFTSWASAILYVGSRIPQILRNHRRKNIEGLAVGMFLISMTGNLLYGLSIVLRLPSPSRTFFESTLAYIIGSVGTVSFDIIIMVQSYMYRNNRKVEFATEEEPSHLDSSLLSLGSPKSLQFNTHS